MQHELILNEILNLLNFANANSFIKDCKILFKSLQRSSVNDIISFNSDIKLTKIIIIIHFFKQEMKKDAETFIVLKEFLNFSSKEFKLSENNYTTFN